MKIDLTQVINLEKNKIGCVCGLGPSLKKYLEQFEYLSKHSNHHIFLSCNEVDEMTKIQVDYWIIANSINTIDKWHTKFNNHPNTTLAYADSVDLTNKNLVDNLLDIKYIPYDQRHFKNLTCNQLLNSELKSLGGYDPSGNCCKHIIKYRLTIQEELQKISKYKNHYGTGDSIAVHMLALAVIIGCNPIYISGVDLNYNLGYVDGITQPWNNDSFEQYMPQILKDFSIINESAKNIGIEIINLSEISPLKNIFKTQNSLS